MWRQPKRNAKCPLCKRAGACGCQRRVNAELARNPAAAPRPCPVTLPNGKTCGKTVRGGVCPSPRPCPVTLPNGKTCGKTVRGGVCPSPDH